MKKIIIANWKAKLGPREAISLAKKYSFLNSKYSLVVCPDFSVIYPISELLKKTKIFFGSQDCSAFPSGAHTGEVSASSLKTLGAKYVIIGHSERRANGEGIDLILQKVQKVLAEKMIPVVCVGESAKERLQKKTMTILTKQLSQVFNKLSPEQKSQKIFVAYEPVWAVGSGQALAPEESEFICGFIKKNTNSLGASKVEVLYGGSVSANNAKEYLNQDNVSGLLIGGASLDFSVFRKIINC
ncbi:MAG: triose-phosphate isomerase [Patescibacteria group bacterium]